MLPFLPGRDRSREHPLLDELAGQTIVHTRVAARGTWTATTRGWVLHSRIQRLEPDPGRTVGLRDARLLGAAITAAEILPDGRLTVSLSRAEATAARLVTSSPWRLDGPQGARLVCDERGELTATAPEGPRYATSEVLAEHAASTPSGLELRLLRAAAQAWLHPGHVVETLAAAGALREEEFERRGPILLSRMLVRGELRAGFVTGDRFTPWPLTVAEVVEHVHTTWRAIGGRTPGRDMIAWFELTPAGRDRLGPRGPRDLPPGMSGYDSPGVVGGLR